MDASSLVTLLNVIALVTIMLSMGLQVKWQAVMASTCEQVPLGKRNLPESKN